MNPAYILVAVLIILVLIWQARFDFGREPLWGVTFSQFYAQDGLHLDWRKTYLAILNELGVRKLRLVAYWQYLEPEKGQFNFSDLDWQIEEAQKRNKEVIMVIGRRVPRWPECHEPGWVKNQELRIKNQELLNYMEKVVNHYKDFSAIKMWQVENEPLLSSFGECPDPDENLLKEEIKIVKSLDPSRPVAVTDSGELSLWFKAAGLGDILGTTLYRVVWNKTLGRSRYLYPPAFYTLRAYLVKKFSKSRDVIVSELQAEPWPSRGQSLADVPLDEQTAFFDLKQLNKNLEFARRTGIREIYLWGVEWWYWRKVNGDSSFWKTGKNLFLKE